MANELIQGECDQRFSLVKEVFANNMRGETEIGEGVAVTLGGKPVVDLWGGYIDSKHTSVWQKDTIVNVFSTTKGVVAICALRLVEAGLLDLDRPVAHYWPEFEEKGKDNITVRQVLSHQAGLPAIREKLPDEALYDWDRMCGALANEEVWWEPGTDHGYHAATFGWLVGEVIHRITGKTVGQYIMQELADPLGLEFYLGLNDEQISRTARISQYKDLSENPETLPLIREIMENPSGMTSLAFTNPFSIVTGTNTEHWRRSEIPSANGHCTARALARLYGALACGGELDSVRVLGKETLDLCSAETSIGNDLVLNVGTRFSHGFMMSQDYAGAAFGPGERSFGHPGAGGSVGFADPDAEIGFGFVVNKMGPHILLDPRATKLIDAVYACL
jgi:CubicO group peptidase (beta-lactamase class C family)